MFDLGNTLFGEIEMTHDNMKMRPDARRQLCPFCGNKGKEIRPITVESLLTNEAKARVSSTEGFWFCTRPVCEVAYYHPETGELFQLEDIRVRIGLKQSQPPRLICYCFDYTVEQIEADIVQKGASKIPGKIKSKCEEGLSRCEETNPQGSCCLSNVHKLVQETQEKYSAVMAGQPHSEAAREYLPDCCAVAASSDKVEATSLGNPRTWTTGGAVVAAVLSSACCWLPLLLIALGASAAGVSGFLEAYRAYFLGATGLLLATGFYLVYFRKEQCEPGSACEAPKPNLRRLNRVIIWVATVMVLLFAFFPNYAGYLLAGSEDPGTASGAPLAKSRLYRIEGMTCEACAIQIEARLRKVPGVMRAEVSYEAGRARIFFDPAAATPADRQIQQAIEVAGYRAFPLDIEKGDSKMEDANLQEIGKAVASMLGSAASTQEPRLPGLLLRLLAEGSPVSPARIATDLNISPDDVISALKQSTAVELDKDGNVTAAFGLTLNPTPHRFHMNGHEFYTWCALDTLYIPGVIGQAARVESTCPATGTKIRLTVTPDGIESLEPADAVMAIAIPEMPQACHGIRESFCDHVHFLSSREAASEWSAKNQKTIVLSVDDAHRVGRIMLEHLFEQASDA